jgi:formate hydrogenlyase subunit 3/multisubunit Na+/H+ antiporter MnhD subunit
MVNPIYIFIIALSVAFLLSVFDKIGRHIAIMVFLLALVALIYISGTWYLTLAGGEQTVSIFTAGFKPPVSINLQLGLEEAFFILLTNIVGFFGGIYLLNRFQKGVVLGMILFLMMIMGINGIIMTRDLFNLFVFMEITSIATYSIIDMEQNSKTLSAGFKYVIAGGLATCFFLIGTIFLYHLAGTLNIDDMIRSQHLITGKTGFIALFFLIFAVLIELKPFPANGWALDVYQAVPSGIVAIIAVASSGGMLFALYKLLSLVPNYLPWIATIGIVTFLFANLIGLKQTDTKRLLGYSSIAQMGLVITALALVLQFPNPTRYLPLVVGGLFINHFIAKAGLFWLAGIIRKTYIKDWGAGIDEWEFIYKDAVIAFLRKVPYLKKQTFLRKHKPINISYLVSRPVFLAVFGGFLFALIGFPPFPGFWAKWELVLQLVQHNMSFWMWLILLGSLLEAVYLLRWFGYTVHNVRVKKFPVVSETSGASSPVTQLTLSKVLPVIVFALLQIHIGWEISAAMSGIFSHYLLPVYAAAILFVLEWRLSARKKSILTLAIIGIATCVILPGLSGIYFVFGLMFLAGSFILLVATFPRQKEARALPFRTGFYPLLLLLILSLGNLLRAENALQFFFSWELMTISSYLLILRGKKAIQTALNYILFSTAGAFFLLAGFAVAAKGSGSLLLSSFTSMGAVSSTAYILLAIGFLIKLGALGVHIWLPGAYSEAEDDFSALLSSVLSKVGIFGLFLVAMWMSSQHISGEGVAHFIGSVAHGLSSEILAYEMGWIGVLTALFGSLMAVFQEDIKAMLAYSSMGQVGYIVLALAMMSHLGWTTALYLSITHLLFKAMLFLAIAGVILRTKTRKMYEMGGLIKQMPFSFISVLIAIIALSGVPPLSGFGGKWLLYTALLEKGWYLQLGAAFFASGVAFLYLFRLIHTIFLGQPKPKLRHVTESPILMLVPQYIFILVIMAISMFPNIIIKPLSLAVAPFHPSTIEWAGFTVKSSLGYWNGLAVMNTTMIIFAIPLIWLLLVMRKPQAVKPFNIVYAAERPDRPETTHYAHNFFAHYRKALGFAVEPLATRFWNGVAEWSHSLAAAFRTIYTGNGQTYALHIVLFLLVLYVLMQ